jgi:uncharacterized cupredoxin-like copper-binding protein
MRVLRGFLYVCGSLILIMGVWMIISPRHVADRDIPNDSPLSTELVDKALKYVFYTGKVNGEFHQYFQYSHLLRIGEVTNDCCVEVQFVVHADCEGYRIDWQNKYPFIKDDFTDAQQCQPSQFATTTLVNVDSDSLEFGTILIRMSPNADLDISNSPRLFVATQYNGYEKLTDLNLNEIDALPSPIVSRSAIRSSAQTTLNVSTDGENLAYSQTSLRASAGKVTIAFNNSSAAQSHSLVIVNGGDDVAIQVNAAASEAGEAAGYMPADQSNFIAHTNILAPGSRETIEFNADAGTYTFICIFPGHYENGMKGTLIIN